MANNDWISISDARRHPGLRVVLTRGFPSPWSFATRWMLEYQAVPYTKVERSDADRAADALVEWTGQDSLPAAIYNNERPRTHWYAIPLLIDQLAANPRLIPEDAAKRALMSGLGNELLGELGLLWCARLVALSKRLQANPDDAGLQAMLLKYGSGESDPDKITQRARDIVAFFANHLQRQAQKGLEYFVGNEPTALDFYWSAASVLIANDEKFGAGERVAGIAQSFSAVIGDIDDSLLALRDRMFERHYSLPLQLD